MDYNFREIEKRWQEYWRDNKTYHVEIDHDKPKFYVLDMFPYPSGAGLHVGHPLGYIASDIYARYKRLKGFNVLHPMGYDAYGLPAEQYAIQTGTHPAVTTEKNINRYREQMDKIGFCFDWDREVRTSDPDYYKWTQWTFIQLFNSYYCNQARQARPISELVELFARQGTAGLDLACTKPLEFTAEQWNAMSEKEQQEVLMNYRLAYLADTMVNWCPELGTVLANDEVQDGLSVRGGFPVVRKSMKQWLLRITAYAERLLTGLDTIDWNESIKDVQRNWIGKSMGASVLFDIADKDIKLEVFTTRADTLFGVTFMVLAPEHPMIAELTSDEQRESVEEYVAWAKNRSERERMSEVKKVSGVFSGSYAVNPFNGTKIPIWISDYVLMGYGTGAIMAVPAHDSRDFAFARHFQLPIIQVVTKPGEEMPDVSEWAESFDAKDGVLINSEFLDGLTVKDAILRMIQELERLGIGKGKTNYRLRDAIFSRQRYWGEPFPIYYKNGMPYAMDVDKLPLQLPSIDAYKPTENGEPPLARAKNWVTDDGCPIETNTMPGFAGSSGYYLRYMDPHNNDEYFSKEANNYWQQVDLYIGGAEHATGHLIYSRFWNKFLFDIGIACKDEPFKKMVNQGMIQGRTSFVYRVNYEKMAEWRMWQLLKDNKLGVEFVRDYKMGRRRFDFYCPSKNIIIEIKKMTDLEKVAEPYESIAKQLGCKILLTPIRSVLNDDEYLDVESKIKEMIAGKDIPEFESGEQVLFPPLFVSKNVAGREFYSDPIRVDINMVHNDILDMDEFKVWRDDLKGAEFICEKDKDGNDIYVCGWEIEKMSKSKYNVQNPDDLVARYGADTLRLYEMFLGPLEQSKPWDTQGIEGVHRFLRKFWKLFVNEKGELQVSDNQATKEELKSLHKLIKKEEEDIERISFNTVVSAFMICVNELSDMRCDKREILEPLTIMISPYAPHIAEELWHLLGHSDSVVNQTFPEFNKDLIVENSFLYPVSFNGKKRFDINLSLDMSDEEMRDVVLAAPESKKWTEGLVVRKVIIIRNKIINIVVG
ncbi:MAG: class I tRNA ligase family protein [Bacteroidales bacterium]|nr:class I tRNA ligase family protein [Bacteroidales bacterium]